jgi:xanthine/uracil permease
VDFSDNRNLLVAAITLVLGTGDFTLKFGGFALGGIGTATFGAILLYWLLNREERNAPADTTATADSAAPR